MGEKISFSYSRGDCPYSHLAIEDQLLEGDFEGDHHLFIYRNRPCIVMGRFQVPWREISFRGWKKFNDIHGDAPLLLVRRFSGGGSVYHDLGNWNFCFVHREREIPRERNFDLLCSELQKFGIFLKVNKKGDLLCIPFEREKKGERKYYKISGSSFKQKRLTSLHHGTLLVHANLKYLKGVLGQDPEWEVSGHGVLSRPSPVMNLWEFKKNWTFLDWISSWEERFGKGYEWEEKDFSLEIKKKRNFFKSWDWLWGECPRFEVKIKNSSYEENYESLCLGFKKGICEKAQIEEAERGTSFLNSLIGKKLFQSYSRSSLLEVKSSFFEENLNYFFRTD